MEAMKRLSSMPAFHHHHGKKVVEDKQQRHKKEDESETSSEEEEEEEDRSEEEEGERKQKKLSRSKSFKLKLLKKMGRGKKVAGKESARKNGVAGDKGQMERERRKDEMIKSYDKKAQLDSATTASSSHIKEIPQTVMCGMNLPGYKSHIKRSASSSSPGSAASAANNRGRRGGTGEDRQAANSSNPLLIHDENERRRAEAKERHRELRLGAVLGNQQAQHHKNRSPSPSSSSSSSSSAAQQQKTENGVEAAKREAKSERRRSGFLLGRVRDHSPSSAAGPSKQQAPWVKGESQQPAASARCCDSGDYAERGEEGIDLMELQRQFQQVGGADDERRVRLAEDRIKGAARLPWWGLNASSGKEGRRKEWERFFSGFKVCELWEDDEGDDEDDDDDDEEDGCRGKKVAYLTEETTVKEALDVMSERALNALPICLKEVDPCGGGREGGKAKAAADGSHEEDEVRERALRHLRKWRKAELVRERERKQRKQRGKTVLGWIDLRDLLTFAVFKFPRPPSADIGIDEVRRQGMEFTQHKIRELVNIYGMNGAHVVNEEGTGGQGRHRIAANDRMPAVFRMLRSEKGLRVLPVYDQSQLPPESRCLVRVLDTNAVIKWLHRVVQDNRSRSQFVRELANRQVRHWGAFADTILGKELIYFETEEMINNFDHFRASKRERRMSKLIIPFGSADGGSTVEVIKKNGKTPSPPPTPSDHPKEKIDLNKHLFTISADRSVIDAFKIIYNYKVSALGVLEKKGKERNVDDESSSDEDEDDDSETEDEDEGEDSDSSSSSSSSSSGEEEEEQAKVQRKKKERDQEKARGPSLKEAKAMVEAARDSSSEDESSSDDDDSETESEEEEDAAAAAGEEEEGRASDMTTATNGLDHSNQPTDNPPSSKRTADSQTLSSGAHAKPRRSQSDPLGLSSSKKANAHDASDTAKTRSEAKERKPLWSRSKKPSARITREEMVVRAAQAGKLISHLSSSDLKHFEPYAMMRCLHMSIKEYLSCFKEKKPLVTCRRDTTLLQLLEKMAREEVNRVWLLADEDDDEDDNGHDRKGKQQGSEAKPKDNGGRPIGMISLADVIAEVTRL